MAYDKISGSGAHYLCTVEKKGQSSAAFWPLFKNETFEFSTYESFVLIPNATVDYSSALVVHTPKHTQG